VATTDRGASSRTARRTAAADDHRTPRTERPDAQAALLALQFLISEDVRLVSACADRDCGWVFLDRDHNRTRRWCSSGDCGNRNRFRIYNARHASRASLHDEVRL
jgi:predicted RNA-binding Zn ribbon-like protein